MDIHNNSIELVGINTMVSSVVFLVLTTYQQQCFLPAYKQAVEEANNQYENCLHFELDSVTRQDITSCVTFTANVADLAASFYYRTIHSRKTLIIISPSKEKAARL